MWAEALAADLASADICVPPKQGLVATDVRYVIDGDSLKLANGQELRIIGINTPEHGDFLADKARQTLKQNLRQGINGGKNSKIKIYRSLGSDKRDSYGRILAHLWLLGDDGRWTSPAINLLEQGLAFHIAIFPNLEYISCYAAAEQQAKTAKRGLWDNWRPLAASSKKLKPGFAFIKGDIVEIIDKGRFGSELIMSGGSIGLWIPAKSYKLFGGKHKLKAFIGQRAVARGWIYRYKDNRRLQLQVSHPAMLDLL